MMGPFGRGPMWPGFGMGHHPMWRRRFFEPGELRLALLALIGERPRHGYDLMKELESRSGGAYRPSAGSIYPTLQQLEDEGLITSKREDGKNVFTVTKTGEAENERERDTAERIWERAKEWGDWGSPFHPGSMEIARHVRHLAKTAFMAVARRGIDPDTVRKIIEKAREEIEESQNL